ncbi:MAG: transcription termination factor NusA [Candidatus Latescibacteria bacterium]|nr:transcription termination factor NusA [Candidatus Latescibacterota bacterium]NIO27332.1 transcription termination factor NusA [Candidatus Latescibacterota bacterium]NIO54856.1 transcription termination factor NusA [Candidatus Latescibacterota bacterium]NIT00939.1 transcription termination factor NusA [Candidatus Latescibacterota bacterium]NIT37862.1 transcription termination factor NusA [Candidatus Latescibacterota bacterium]
MSIQIADALNQLIREKRLDRKLLMETLSAGLSSAIKKKFGTNAEAEVVEDGRGNIEVYLLKTVVEDVENEGSEISIADAKQFLKKPKLGDQVRISVPFEAFGRNAIQITKQILTQKIREFERDRTYEEYKDRVGEVVSGTVQQIDRNNILVNLGNAEATIPRKEQIRRERYNQGSSIRACITKVDKDAKGSMITLSRTSPEFLKKLFSHEVPEIYEGLIEIKSVAREAGGRSKIAVYSRDERVDAVGACVGMKGSRVQAVVNELSGERIDIVPWSEDISAFVSRALSPAKISGVRVDSDNKTVLVIVEEDQLSLAIGKEGQNVRLASKLTGWQIELVSSRELEQRERLQEHLIMAIEDMVGVTAKMAEKLKVIGIHTVQKLMSTPAEEILAIPGVGAKTAEKLLATGEKTMNELNKALEELIQKENEEREIARKEEKPLFDESILESEEPTEKKEELPPEAPLTEETLFKEAPADSEEAEETSTDAAESAETGSDEKVEESSQ